jgi:Uri superfamily endonuclease
MSTDHEPEKSPGTYVLILACDESGKVSIGKRLAISLQPGYYCYVGSALGPGGLAARLGHHTRPVQRPHWHIDYLREHARLIEIWYGYGNQWQECLWSQLIKSIGELYVPIKGFGASDCACTSHLMYSSTRPDVELFKNIVMKQTEGRTRIQCINTELDEDGNG